MKGNKTQEKLFQSLITSVTFTWTCTHKWANSVKGHVQKCHENWARFRPYSLIFVFLYILQPINIPVSGVFLFHYCAFTKWCYWCLSYFYLLLLSFCSDQHSNFLSAKLLPAVTSPWGAELVAWLGRSSCSGCTTRWGLNWWQLFLDTGLRKIMRTHTCSGAFTLWCGSLRRGQVLFEAGQQKVWV